MTALRRLIAPIGFLLLLVIFAHAEGDLAERSGVGSLGERGRAVVKMATFLVVAWLLSRVADAILSGLRPRIHF